MVTATSYKGRSLGRIPNCRRRPPKARSGCIAKAPRYERRTMEAQTPAPEPRRLYRSRDDRLIGGVCGGLAKHFGVDSIVVRVAAVVLLLFGGASALAYLAFLLLVPEEPREGEPPPLQTDRGRVATIVAIVALVLIGGPFLLLGGFVVAGVALPLAFLAL